LKATAVKTIVIHLFLIALVCFLALPQYNISFTSENLSFNATFEPNLNDQQLKPYDWYLNGSSTYVEDFEDLSHSFTTTVPTDSVWYYATIYNYSGTLSGTIEDTYYDDGNLLVVQMPSAGVEAYLTLDIDISSIPTGDYFYIYWATESVSGASWTVRLFILDSSHNRITEYAGIGYSGKIGRTKQAGDYYVELYVHIYSSTGQFWVGVDWFAVEQVGVEMGSSTEEIVYVASKAGTTSQNAGFSPLMEGLSTQLYGYHVIDKITTTTPDTYTFKHTWDFTDIDAGTALIDFCIFVNYVTVNSSLANYIKLTIKYTYSSGDAQYIVYFAPNEAGTLESGSQYIMYKTSVKTMWISLKTFKNKQPSQFMTVSGTLSRVTIEVEFSHIALGDNEPKIDFIVDWIGAWTPQDQISSVKYSLFYEISHKGFENISIATVPTLDYDSSMYRQVLLFYDTRYPTSWTTWTDVDSIFTKLETYLPQLGFAVQRVDADELADYLSGGVKAIVLILSGCMPDTIYDPPNNNYLIRDWIRNGGGVLVWAGDWIGYYSGHADGTKTTVWGTGDDKVFGVNVIALDWGCAYCGTYTVCHNITPLAQSFGLYWGDNWGRPICIDLYENGEGKNYLLYVWAKRVVIDCEGKALRAVRVAIGWFQFGNGWTLVFPTAANYFGVNVAVKNIVAMIVTAPFRQNKDVTNMAVWDDGYITTDVFYDDTFRECNSPDEEDPAEAFGENFAGIGDWSTDSGGDPTVSWSTDGDKLVFSFSAAADSADDYAWIYKTVSIDLTQYPFLEVRWKGECTVGDPYFYIYAVVSDGSTSQGGWLKSHSGAFDWTIDRVNILEWARTKFGSAYTTLTKIRIYINDYPNTEETDCTLYVDWIRVYGFSGVSYLLVNAGSNDYAYSDGDVLCIHMNFDQSGVDEYMSLRYDIADFDATGKWAEARTKGYVEILFLTSDGYFGWIIESSDWVTSKIDLESRQIYTSATVLYTWNSGTSKTVTKLAVVENDISQYDSGVTKEGYVDYIKIGSKGGWRPIWEFSASKFYDNPYWHFYDSLISPKWNLPEGIATGVYQYQIGVLMLVWGYNYIDDDYMYYVFHADAASLRAIHTYSWYVVTAVDQKQVVRGFSFDPNLAAIPLGSWLVWLYALLIDSLGLWVEKRQLYLLSTLLIVLGMWMMV